MFGINPETCLPALLLNSATGTDFIGPVPQPFFRVVLQDRNGVQETSSALDAMTANLVPTENGARIHYNFLNGRNLSVVCNVCKGEDAEFEFGIEVDNRTGDRLLLVEYPIIALPAELESADSDWVLWDRTLSGGVLIHGFANAFGESYKAFDGSHSEPLQFCVCGTSKESLYFCTMDSAHHMKNLQPVWKDGSLVVSNRHFVDEPAPGRFSLPYAAGFSCLDTGEWYGAAEMYRDWAERQSWTSRKLWERDDIPAWWLESPIVLSIKERGKRNSDMGQRTSPWCHPLENGIPRIMELAKKFESVFKVQVFHWEKAGAFQNGDHFPPLSGFDGTRKFFDMLHAEGHYGGVYVLPLKWTLRGHATGYDGSEFFEAHDAMGNACLDAAGKPIFSLYDWKWRKRLFMCGAAPETRRQIVETFKTFSELGADYIQFDTFNGRLYDCWNEGHGHQSGPGSWQHEAAASLIGEIKRASRPFIFTFEAEPTESMLQLGHGYVERGIQPVRKKGWESVPLHQFVYHQYTQAFAGENNGSWNTPDNFFMATAISIVSGDMLMINLSEQGRIAMQTHEIDDFDQTIDALWTEDLVTGFIRDMNRLRREFARQFLVLGRMLRAPRIECAVGKVLEGDDLHPSNADGLWKPQPDAGYRLLIPAILGSSWKAPDGSEGSVFINHTLESRTAVIDLRTGKNADARFILSNGSSGSLRIENGMLNLTLSPLSGVVLIPEQ